jgi:predicted small metal-binding protein
MLQVACKDIGVLGCDFVAQGDKVRKVEGNMIGHILETHPQLAAGLTFEQRKELEARIISGIHAVEARNDRPEAGKHAVLRVACADLRASDCDFVAADCKPRRLQRHVFDHLRDRHPEMLAGLTLDGHDELQRRVKAAARPE